MASASASELTIVQQLGPFINTDFVCHLFVRSATAITLFFNVFAIAIVAEVRHKEWPYFLGYTLLLTLHTVAILTLKTWAFRRRVANFVHMPQIRTIGFRLVRLTETVIDYEVNSRFVSTVIYWVLTATFTIVSGTATGHSGLFAPLGFTIFIGLAAVCWEIHAWRNRKRREASEKVQDQSLWKTTDRDL